MVAAPVFFKVMCDALPLATVTCCFASTFSRLLTGVTEDGVPQDLAHEVRVSGESSTVMILAVATFFKLENRGRALNLVRRVWWAGRSERRTGFHR